MGPDLTPVSHEEGAQTRWGSNFNMNDLIKRDDNALNSLK